MRNTLLYDRLENFCKGWFIVSLALLVLGFLSKDRFPETDFFEQQRLQAPKQTSTERTAFDTQVNGQIYRITPLYDYEINGVVVTDYENGSFGDIYHHRKWKDFLNVKDLCVVWGSNVSSGIFREMDYDSGPWTCWVRSSDSVTYRQFKGNELSNNHVLTDQLDLHHKIMASEPGDQIRMRGVLAHYANLSNGFERSTSTTRTDTGNGACETLYVDEFEIVRKANPGWRRLYRLSFFSLVASILLFSLILLLRPTKRPYQ